MGCCCCPFEEEPSSYDSEAQAVCVRAVSSLTTTRCGIASSANWLTWNLWFRFGTLTKGSQVSSRELVILYLQQVS